MSKYNVGDKFIINIKEVLESERGTLYRADFSTLAFDDYGLDKLQKIKPELKIEDIDDMIAEYDLRKTSYDQGSKDAWELAQKINCYAAEGGILQAELVKIFGSDDTCKIMCLSYEEALAKLKAYEESQNKIEVGDVVELSNMTIGVVTKVGGNCANVVHPNGNVSCMVLLEELTKTDKHIDIKSILEQIGE